MRNIILCIGVGLASLTATAQTADYVYVPPGSKNTARPVGPVAASAMASALGKAYPRFSIDTYAGMNAALKRTAVLPGLQVGAGVELDWSDTPLFEAPEVIAGRYHWRAAIQSVDAEALRLKVDLSTLEPGDEVWVADTAGNRAFGPYTLADSEPEGRWLATTLGDNAVLWVTTEASSPPAIAVRALSHFYESPLTATKQNLNCPVQADCATGTALQEVSTGIGRLTITDNVGTSALCSGALINNPATEDLEAYFLTADHCFQDYPGTIPASGLEVAWDFRANGCGNPEPGTSILPSLPRSTGTAFLANSTTIDAMLLQLAGVPIGDRGRAWLGWDTRSPVVNENVVGLHHPQGTAMKASFGVVRELGVNSNFGQNQTTLSWSDGITEGGSSGSPSMFNNGNFRIFGMLSNGNFQSCGAFGQRLDQYSSFRDFFSQISSFVNAETPPNTGRNVYAENNTGGGGNNGDDDRFGCLLGPAKSAARAGDLLLTGLALMTLGAMGHRTTGGR